MAIFGISSVNLVAFIVTAVVMVNIPGPSMLFIVSRALANGRRVAVLSVLGNSVGEYVQVIAVAFGIGAIAERSVVLFTVMKLVGGLYLIYLGIKTFRERRAMAAAVEIVAPATSDRKSFRQGMVVGVSNPKTVVFMAAILPQFVTPAAGDVAAQILLLGLVFSVVAIMIDTAWALAAGAFRTWFERSPRRLEIIGGAGGVAIAAVGAVLLALGRHP